ncbi:Ig-like domain-containing protein [Acidicapsa ligni]|uniref:Ig-like domain-containing protein n=1 Tax=Acidicapsa ligni TaxID=542300 RepID=UPI0021DF80DB|nr:Ig-like domain-containing protein [Acidicapsa ligni]
MSLPQRARRINTPLALTTGLLICALAIAFVVHSYLSPPTAISVYPTADEAGVDATTRITITFNRKMLSGTINPSTFQLRDDRNRIIPTMVAYEDSPPRAVLSPLTALSPGSTYQITLTGGVPGGGQGGVMDIRRHALATNRTWKFTTGIAPPASPADGPGGPILLVTSSTNGFSQYYAEILRNEGFNEFAVTDIAHLDSATLNKYDLVLMGEFPITKPQVRLLTDWVSAGGNLIAMRPEKQLVESFGLSLADPAALPPSIHDAYIKIDSKTPMGAGLVKQPIQFHGSADLYDLHEATPLALLYRDAKTATPYPASCMRSFGHGNVVLFSYDLARSIVYTRQGNPLWSGIDRDGIPPVRSDDLFYGASKTDQQPDWVDPAQIAIPQADEQQRLLANIITLTNAEKKPLPHFWYLPRGLKAVIVMTGDDHGKGGTVGRFRSYLKKSPPGCSIENWECVRATSNIFVGSISPSQAATFAEQGFEIGLHVYTACTDWPTKTTTAADGTISRSVIRQSADALYTQQLKGFATEYPGVPAPVSNRTDCVTWGDYDTQPQVELIHGIRFDTNYYYWPPKWVQNRPGMFTGSGMPMRFARQDGTLVDVYQATTQMTDESSQIYPYTVDSLLSNALGSSEYYGVFTANMHNDWPKSQGADAILSSALARHVPIVTASQMLKWLDGRNASAFRNLTWSQGQLSFATAIGTGGNGVQVLLPMASSAGNLTSLSLNGHEIRHGTRTIAGLTYAAFPAAPGKFVATYRTSQNATASR